jgi:hypothetical protein
MQTPTRAPTRFLPDGTLKRKKLEAASCECYGVIRPHFERLGL